MLTNRDLKIDVYGKHQTANEVFDQYNYYNSFYTEESKLTTSHVFSKTVN
jgi:hypothetical protein